MPAPIQNHPRAEPSTTRESSMVIKPRVRGFMCVTAHPEGCRENVRQQIDHVTRRGTIEHGPRKVLVIGASTGYGLASRITAAIGACGATRGVFLESEGTSNRSASAGWYISADIH